MSSFARWTISSYRSCLVSDKIYRSRCKRLSRLNFLNLHTSCRKLLNNPSKTILSFQPIWRVSNDLWDRIPTPPIYRAKSMYDPPKVAKFRRLSVNYIFDKIFPAHPNFATAASRLRHQMRVVLVSLISIMYMMPLHDRRLTWMQYHPSFFRTPLREQQHTLKDITWYPIPMRYWTPSIFSNRHRPSTMSSSYRLCLRNYEIDHCRYTIGWLGLRRARTNDFMFSSMIFVWRLMWFGRLEKA